MQKSTLSVLDDVKLPGQFVHIWHFVDKIAPFLMIVDNTPNIQNIDFFCVEKWRKQNI